MSSNYSLNTTKQNKNSNAKKYLVWKPSRINTNPHALTFYIPNSWNFVLIKKHNKMENNSANFLCYLANSCYFFVYPINLFFSVWSFTRAPFLFTIYAINRSNFLRTFWKRLILIFHSFTKIFFIKLKFKGKGYYIYKNKRNTIALQFNYSHIKRLYFYFTYVKFLSKISVILYGVNPRTLITAGNLFIKMRPLNIFTGKGVRFNRQIIYRKTGKVSSYR